jgi:hypothetical protein
MCDVFSCRYCQSKPVDADVCVFFGRVWRWVLAVGWSFESGVGGGVMVVCVFGPKERQLRF